MDQLLAIINEMFEESGVNTLSSLDKDMHLRDDLHMDSFMLAELTVRIEAELDIDIFEDGIVETIGEIIAKIEDK